jgi:metal-responsive CopG/Arc/MetJ family transcriptional regulator
MGKIKITISMDEDIYEDLSEVAGDEYNYGFQNRSHLISQAVKELLEDRGYYEEDEDEVDPDDDE